MDLNHMTREELETEARRLGVDRPNQLTRAQLVRAIERRADPGAIDTAKALFRGVLGVARSLRKKSADSSRASSAATRPVRTSLERAPSEKKTQVLRPAARKDAHKTKPAVPSGTTAKAASVPPPAQSSAERVTSQPADTLSPSVAPSALADAQLSPSQRPPAPAATDAPRAPLSPDGAAGASTSPGAGRSRLPPLSSARQGITRPLRAVSVAEAEKLVMGRPTLDIRPPAVAASKISGTSTAATAATAPDVTHTRPLRTVRPSSTPAAPGSGSGSGSGSGTTNHEAEAARAHALEEEPIPTRTMAKLLHDQGHHRRALAILEKLIAESGSNADPALTAEAAMIRKKVGASEVPLSGAALPAESGAELVTMRLPGGRVLLAWGIPDISLTSAQALGARGELYARAVVVAPSDDGSVSRETIDQPALATGEWSIGPFIDGAYITAAVGFRYGKDFVSVAHAPVLELD